MKLRRLSILLVLMLLGAVLISGCGSNGDVQDEGAFLQVKAWEGWVRVESVLVQESDWYTKEQTDCFLIEVLLDDQDKFTGRSKWFGESDNGSHWEQSDYYHHEWRHANKETIWESYGTGTGFGQISLEIEENTGRYLIMVGASLKKLFETTRIEQGRKTYESDLYEHERFAGLWTGWVDLPGSGLVLKGRVENLEEDVEEIIEWELWPKGKAPKGN